MAALRKSVGVSGGIQKLLKAMTIFKNGSPQFLVSTAKTSMPSQSKRFASSSTSSSISQRSKFAVDIKDPTPAEELQLILGELPVIDSSAKDNFMELFENSPFAKMGNNVDGIHVEAIVKSKDDNGVMVDFGSKFPARITWKTQQDPAKSLNVGDWLVIELKDIERTEHLLGDSKPVTIHRAIAHHNFQGTVAMENRNVSMENRNEIEDGIKE